MHGGVKIIEIAEAGLAAVRRRVAGEIPALTSAALQRRAGAEAANAREAC